MEIVTNILSMLARGIPALVLAGVILILMFLALIRKESGLMMFAAFLMIPFAYALGAWSGFGLFVRLLPLFSLTSAFALGKEDSVFAWLFSSPIFVYLVYLLFKILVSGAAGI